MNPLQLRVGLRGGGNNVSTSGMPMAQMAQWTTPANTTTLANEKVFEAVPCPQDSSMALGASNNRFQELHVDAADVVRDNSDYSSIDGYFSHDAENITDLKADVESTESLFVQDNNLMVLDGKGATYDGEDGKAEMYGGQNEMQDGQDETYLEFKVYKEQVQTLEKQLDDAKKQLDATKKQLDDARRLIEFKNGILSKQKTRLSELSTESLQERREGWANTVKTCLDDYLDCDSVDGLVKDICIKVVTEIDRHPAVKAFVSLHTD